MSGTLGKYWSCFTEGEVHKFEKKGKLAVCQIINKFDVMAVIRDIYANMHEPRKVHCSNSWLSRESMFLPL